MARVSFFIIWMVAWHQANGDDWRASACVLKWLVRIIGALLLVVAAAMAAILVLTGLELDLNLGALRRQAWLPVVALLVAAGLGMYLLLTPHRPTPVAVKEKEEE